MQRRVVAVLLAAVVLLASVGPALAAEATTQPAKTDLQQEVHQAQTWARWGCILAGLALLGVLWIAFSMQTLAKNQVQVARMIQAGKAQ